MLPVTQALNARFIPQEAEGLHAISTITPVEAAKAEVPLWNRLRQGMQFNGLVLQKEQPASSTSAGQSALATFRVQLNLPGQLPQLVLMQLPAQMPAQQQLQLQVLGPMLQGAQQQVKWTMPGQTRALDQALHPVHLTGDEDTDLDMLLDDTNAGHPGGVASQVELSHPARHLQKWLDSAHFPAQSSGLQAQTVVSQHPEKPQLLAQDLKQALDSSGLFYESHLKQATLGARPWQQLMQEPQNLPQFSAPDMVSQQLQVLEQQRVVWQGEVWPGQTMSWQVTERAPQQEHPQAEQQGQTLFSNLDLQLPHLGDVSVRITMVDGRFSVRVQASDTASRQVLAAAKSRLAANMSQAGLKLDGLQISERSAHVG